MIPRVGIIEGIIMKGEACRECRKWVLYLHLVSYFYSSFRSRKVAYPLFAEAIDDGLDARDVLIMIITT